MAVDEDGNEIIDDGQIDDQQALNTDDDDQQQVVSPTTDDSQGNDRATEERLKRLEERNQYLENTQRLLDQFNQRQQPQQQQVEPALPDDVQALDKLLEPAVNRRFQKGLEPLIGTISELKEENDASKFENFLNRTEGELFDPDNEQKLNAVYQGVDNFRRQIAQQRGQWISRQDAYLYLSGVERAKEKLAGRKSRQAQGIVQERQRVSTAKVAASLDRQTPRQETAGHENLVKKLRANQRLSGEELEKLRNSPLADVEF